MMKTVRYNYRPVRSHEPMLIVANGYEKNVETNKFRYHNIRSN